MTLLIEQPPAKTAREESDRDKDDVQGNSSGNLPPDDFDNDDFDGGRDDDDDSGDDDDSDDEDENDAAGQPAGDRIPWVTLATFSHPAEAQLARLKLDAEGIACVILDENLVATDWLLTTAVGGIKLQVPKPEAPAAFAALRGSASAGAMAGSFMTGGEYHRCPRCDSTNVEAVRMPWLASFILRVLRVRATPSRQCMDCGQEWQPTAPAFPIVPVEDSAEE